MPLIAGSPNREGVLKLNRFGILQQAQQESGVLQTIAIGLSVMSEIRFFRAMISRRPLAIPLRPHPHFF